MPVKWEVHFAYINKAKKNVWIGVCRHCGQDVARPNYSTSGLKDHMERRHKNELQSQCDQVPGDGDSPLLREMKIVKDKRRRRVLPDEYPVAKVVDHRWNTAKDSDLKRRGGKPTGRMEYRVEWEGYPGENTWEPYAHFTHAQGKLRQYIKITRLAV